MKQSIKQILWATLFILFIHAGLDAQVSVLQYRNVPQENVDEFIFRETTYWSKVAKKAIDDGKLLGWSLWERVGGWNMDDNSANFVFVNNFADANALDNMGGVWNPGAVFPDARISDMETGSLSHTIHEVFVQGAGVLSAGEQFEYAVVNYAKASNLNRYIELERTVWMPFAKPLIESGATSQKYWSVSRVLSPRGTVVPFNAMTVDGFKTLGDALSPSFPEGTEFPSLEEFSKVHEKAYIQIYRLVKSVQ